MYEFTWIKKGSRQYKLVPESEHKNFWIILNEDLSKQLITFPFCKWIPKED